MKPIRPIALVILLAATLALSACAMPRAPGGTIADDVPDADRRAILAMLGDYEVTFDFRETATLAPAYTRKPAQSSAGYETVVLVEEQPGRIVLQHLLVSADGAHVTKHWRQDWHYQARQRLEFQGAQHWRMRALSESQVAGGWTQCVYEVSDAPRYCGTGRWVHALGISTWTSDLTWRPLPRREFTTRRDYDALIGINRHTITPQGWTHEQDNTKAVTADGRATALLAREAGFNEYRRVTHVDFSPAHRYWAATRAYWSDVRLRWHEHITRHAGLRLSYPVEGMDMIIDLFTQAQAVAEGTPADSAALEGAFERWVAAP